MICAGEIRSKLKSVRKGGLTREPLMQKPYSVGDFVWMLQEIVPPKGTKKPLKKWRGPFQKAEVHQGGRFYRLNTERAAHYDNITGGLVHSG